MTVVAAQGPSVSIQGGAYTDDRCHFMGKGVSVFFKGVASGLFFLRKEKDVKLRMKE